MAGPPSRGRLRRARGILLSVENGTPSLDGRQDGLENANRLHQVTGSFLNGNGLSGTPKRRALLRAEGQSGHFS